MLFFEEITQPIKEYFPTDDKQPIPTIGVNRRFRYGKGFDDSCGIAFCTRGDLFTKETLGTIVDDIIAKAQDPENRNPFSKMDELFNEAMKPSFIKKMSEKPVIIKGGCPYGIINLAVSASAIESAKEYVSTLSSSKIDRVRYGLSAPSNYIPFNASSMSQKMLDEYTYLAIIWYTYNLIHKR